MNSKLSLACKIVSTTSTLGHEGSFIEDEDAFDDDFGHGGDSFDGDDQDGIVDGRVDFEVDFSQLVQEEPQVENISLAYAKVPKRVDVRKVKENLWQKVMPLVDSEDKSPSAEPKSTPEESKPVTIGVMLQCMSLWQIAHGPTFGV